jgi:hypothetical protein
MSNLAQLSEAEFNSKTNAVIARYPAISEVASWDAAENADLSMVEVEGLTAEQTVNDKSQEWVNYFAMSMEGIQEEINNA